MRLGVRNSGNSIRLSTQRLLTGAPSARLATALRQARERRDILRGTPESETRHLLLAREDWLIRCLEEEMAKRHAGAEPSIQALRQ